MFINSKGDHSGARRGGYFELYDERKKTFDEIIIYFPHRSNSGLVVSSLLTKSDLGELAQFD